MPNRNVTLDDLLKWQENIYACPNTLVKIVQARVDSEEAQDRAYTAELERLAQVERDRVVHYLDAGLYLCGSPFDTEAKSVNYLNMSQVTCAKCRELLSGKFGFQLGCHLPSTENPVK